MFSLRSTVPILSVLVLALGCAGGHGNYARSVYGTKGGYSMRNVHAHPVNLMVAHKIDLPLYIVLDPSKVKNTWDMQTDACATQAPGCEHFKLMDFQLFVRRDLRNAMKNYFTRVEVVGSKDALPKTPYVEGDVDINNVRLHALDRGDLTYQIIEMTWQFALRRSDQQDYAYSFAGTATSGDSYPTFEAGCAQLVDNAIPGMLKKWTEKGGMDALREPAGAASDPSQE